MDENILEASGLFLKRFGCDHQEIIGRHISDIFPSQQDDGSPSMEQWRGLTLLDPILVEEMEFPFLFQSPTGQKINTRVRVRDLNLADQPLQLLQFEFGSPPEAGAEPSGSLDSIWLEKGNLDSLGLLAGGVAHDFNNFLLAILGNADLLDRDLAAGKTGTELLDEIRKAAGRAADLCNQLLAYSGNAQPHFQAIDLTATIQQMVPMLKVAISRKIVLHINAADGLPLVEVDLAQIHQVIMNLVVNSS